MGKTKIRLNLLDESSIENAIQELETYRQELKQKNAEFVHRLAQTAEDVAKNVLDGVPARDRGNASTTVDAPSVNDLFAKTAMTLTGHEVGFLEFSSGVRFGTQYYPLPFGAPYGAGTFTPNKGHWADLQGWWYEDPEGSKEYHHTYGVPAYMPMYHGLEAITLEMANIAEDVF